MVLVEVQLYGHHVVGAHPTFPPAQATTNQVKGVSECVRRKQPVNTKGRRALAPLAKGGKHVVPALLNSICYDWDRVQGAISCKDGDASDVPMRRDVLSLAHSKRGAACCTHARARSEQTKHNQSAQCRRCACDTDADATDGDREEVSAAPHASLCEHALDNHWSLVVLIGAARQSFLGDHKALATAERRRIESPPALSYPPIQQQQQQQQHSGVGQDHADLACIGGWTHTWKSRK